MLTNPFFLKIYRAGSCTVIVAFSLLTILSSNLVHYSDAQPQPLPQLVQYCSDDRAFNIRYPITWNRNETEGAVHFKSPDGQAGVFITSTWYDGYSSFPPDPDRSAANILAGMRNNPTVYNNLTFFDQESGWVDIKGPLPREYNAIFGHPLGFKLVYQYNDPGFGPVKNVDVSVADNTVDYAYNVRFYATPGVFQNYEATFNEMLKAFNPEISC